MKKLDLATLGVEEMDDAQMQEVDGGGWFDVFEIAKAYYDFACSYIEFGSKNADIVSVGANCM